MDDFDFFMEDQEIEKEEFPNLPEELRGIDLNPDESEKLKNDFPTLKQYITISVPLRKDIYISGKQA